MEKETQGRRAREKEGDDMRTSHPALGWAKDSDGEARPGDVQCIAFVYGVLASPARQPSEPKDGGAPPCLTAASAFLSLAARSFFLSFAPPLILRFRIRATVARVCVV